MGKWLRKREIDLRTTRIDDDFGKDLSEKQKGKMRQMYDELNTNFGELVYGIEMANIALKLVVKYGNLIEVRCLEGPVPLRIELIYEDGHTLVVTERSGYLDIALINFGYEGTGPDCFCAFLRASGFDISIDEVAVMRAPFILRKGTGIIKAEGDTKRFVKRLLHGDRIKDRKGAAGLLDKLGWKPSSGIEKVYHLIAKGELDELVKNGESVVEPLIQALGDEVSDIRSNSARVLGEIGGAGAVKALIQALKDQNSTVRENAAEALDKLGWKPSGTEEFDYLAAKREWNELARIGKPAVESLIRAMKASYEDISRGAARALVMIGEPAVEPLIQALKDEIWFVRERAAATLGEIGDVRAFEPLSDALKDEKDSTSFCEAAAHALEKMGKPRRWRLLLKRGKKEIVGAPKVMRFVDNGDGTVTDNITGLMWQRDDDGQPRNYETALEFSKNLGLGGYSNWRLPRKEELTELASLGCDTLKHIFPNMKAEIYWAITTDQELYWAKESADKIAYTVDFDPESGNYGTDVTYFKYYEYYVRAVRNTK